MLGKSHVVGSLAFVHVGLALHTVYSNRAGAEADATATVEPITVFGFTLGEPMTFTAYSLIVVTITLFSLLLLRIGRKKLFLGYLVGMAFCLFALAVLFDTSHAFQSALILLSFTLGTLLPDIDSETSSIGRYVKPISSVIPHRTITHTIWIVALITGFGWYLKSLSLLALGLGYAIHIAQDAFSKQGICWFYPIIGRYDYFSNGGAVKHGKRFPFMYKVGGTGETLFFYGSIAVHVLCVGFVTWQILQ